MSKGWIFFFFAWGQLMRHPLMSFSTFPNCFTCWTTVEWLTLSSLATSRVVVRGSAYMTALNCSLSTSEGQPLHSSSSRLSSPLQNFLSHQYTVCLLVLGSNVLLTLQVISTVLRPIFNLNKKVTWICFLSNIISIV